MLKQKLIQKRKEKGFSQVEMAYKLTMEQSQYSRRENGKTFITTKEWVSMAKILDTSVADIYEPQDGMYVIKYVNQNEDSGESLSHFQNHNDYALDIQKKYIARLEEENARLRNNLKTRK